MGLKLLNTALSVSRNPAADKVVRSGIMSLPRAPLSDKVVLNLPSIICMTGAMAFTVAKVW